MTLKAERMPNSRALSSSLSGVSVSPRTPKFSHRMGPDDEAEDEVELNLLGEDEQRQAANGLDIEEQFGHPTHSLSSEDKRAMVLLCVLCMILHLLYEILRLIGTRL